MGFQIGFPALRNYPSPYDTDALAMFNARAAVGDEPAAAYKQVISDYVVALKDAGLWDDIVQLVVLAGATTVNGVRLAVKGNNLASVNFVNGDIGLKTGSLGDGSSKYWLTGYSGTVSGTGQNDFHTYLYSTNGASVSPPGTVIGCGRIGAGTYTMVANQTRNRSSTIDSAASIVPTPTGTPWPAGGFGMNRTASGSYQRMYPGITETITQTSQAPIAEEYTLLVRREGATIDAYLSASPIIWSMGSGLSSIEDHSGPAGDLITALNAI